MIYDDDRTLPYPTNIPHDVLRPAEERALLVAMAGGDLGARYELVKCNQRLIVSIARRYLSRGLGLMDLIQEGNLGLLHALGKYDLTKMNADGRPLKLSTYATAWIRQRMERALDDRATLVRLPVHMCEQVTRLRKAEAELLATLGDWPSEAELAEALVWDAARVRRVRAAAHMAYVDSLDRPYGPHVEGGPDDAFTLAHTVADPADGLAQVDEADAQVRGRALLANLFTALDAPEQRVLVLRYGLDGLGRKRTLEEVGTAIGLTRERARQIEAAALRKLRGAATLARQITACQIAT